MNLAVNLNNDLDLVFEKTTHLTPQQIWKGWTDPQTILKWFCPRPWKVTQCRIELKPGGEFFTFMEGPQGEKIENHGCFLEIIENKKLVWTNIMTKGFRPLPTSFLGFPFVGTINLSPAKQETQGTLYRAVVAHGDIESRNKHEKMGFQEGWGTAFNQLIELYK